MNRSSPRAGVTLALTLGLATNALAQSGAPQEPTVEQLAKDNRLFLTVAGKSLHWEEPADPVRIVGPLYFVGTRGLGSWLFATSEGLILLNTGMPSSGPMIVA